MNRTNVISNNGSQSTIMPVWVFYKVRNGLFVISITLYLLSLSPFIFVELVSSEQRLYFIIASTFMLALSTKRISFWQIVLLSSIVLWIVLFMIMSESIDHSYEKIHNIQTISAIFVWAVFLHRALEFNQSIRALLVNYYMKLTGLLAACSVISPLYYLLFGSYFFGISITTENYNYVLTPFGVLLNKAFFGVPLLRACNYFSEPVIASLLFAVNFFITGKKKITLYKVLNLIAGLLLFSYMYYLLFIYFHLMFRKKNIKLIYAVFFIIFMVLLVQVTELMEMSSIAARSQLFDVFFDNVALRGSFEWLFGTNDIFIQSFHYSAGLIQLVWDYGLVGFILYWSLIFIIASRHYMVAGAVLLASFGVDLSIYPVYYLVVAIAGILLTVQRDDSGEVSSEVGNVPRRITKNIIERD